MGTTGLTAQAFGRGDGAELRAGLGRALLLAGLIAALLLLAGTGIRSAAQIVFEPERAGRGRARHLSPRPAARRPGRPRQSGPARLAARHAERARPDGAADRDQRRQHRPRSVVRAGLRLGGRRRRRGHRRAPNTAAPASASGWRCRRLRGLAGAWRWRTLRAGAAFRRLLAVNRDILLRSLCLEAAFLTFTALSSRQGEIDARRQRGPVQLSDLRGLRPRRLRPRRRGDGRPLRRRRRPGRPARRDRRQPRARAWPRRPVDARRSCSAAARRSI